VGFVEPVETVRERMLEGEVGRGHERGTYQPPTAPRLPGPTTQACLHRAAEAL
jgi:hypothetical protein